MKGRQVVRLHSYLRTGIVLRDNIAIVATVPAAMRFLRDFDALLMEALTRMYEQAEPIKPVTLNKKALREDMITTSVRLGGIAAAYALSVKDHVSYCQLILSYTFINRSRDVTARAHCQNICNAIVKLLPELKDYGIKKKDTDALQVLINDFNKNYVTPRGAIISRKVSTEMLDTNLKATAKFLNNLFDNLMPGFAAYADFCKAYDTTRKPAPHAKAKRELDKLIKKYYTMPKLPKDRRRKVNAKVSEETKELVEVVSVGVF